jgi:uncharacterized membrane protein
MLLEKRSMPITPPLSELWRAMPPAIACHALTAGYSLLCGLWLLARRRRGDGLHRGLGVSWMLAMAVTALGSFWIQSQGHLSWIHLLSLLTLIGLGQNLYALRHGRRRMHYKAVRGMMIGLGVAFVFTLSPDRILGHWLWAQW